MSTIPERADGYMERIQRVYDEHMDMLEKMLDDDGDVSPDEVVRDMVRAEYNFDQLAALYELDQAVFVETVEKTCMYEDIDIWLDLIMKEPDE